MSSSISTSGLPALSESEKLFKSHIETAIDLAGLVTLGGGVATSSSNGEISLTGLTATGGVVVFANAATGTNTVTHAVAATDKFTVYVNGGTNVAASVKLAYIATKLT